MTAARVAVWLLLAFVIGFVVAAFLLAGNASGRPAAAPSIGTALSCDRAPDGTPVCVAT